MPSPRISRVCTRSISIEWKAFRFQMISCLFPAMGNILRYSEWVTCPMSSEHCPPFLPLSPKYFAVCSTFSPTKGLQFSAFYPPPIFVPCTLIPPLCPKPPIKKPYILAYVNCALQSPEFTSSPKAYPIYLQFKMIHEHKSL